jgi:hypothetical protein
VSRILSCTITGVRDGCNLVRSVSTMLVNRYTLQRELCWPFTFRKQRQPCVPETDPANSRIGVQTNLKRPLPAGWKTIYYTTDKAQAGPVHALMHARLAIGPLHSKSRSKVKMPWYRNECKAY